MFRVLFIAVFGISLARCLPINSYFEENDAEYGSHFEGDMILSQDQLDIISSHTRTGLIDTKYRWPNKTVPCQWSPDHTIPQRVVISLALRIIEDVTCVKFIARSNEKDYINITAEDGGCYSHVGYQGGAQVVNLVRSELGKGCFRLGSIMHQFLHALGFYHMQSAVDRDEYVTVNWDNTDQKHNFKKYNTTVVTDFDVPYDYFSIMHDSAYAFTANGKPTIIPKDRTYMRVIGQRLGLSEKDIFKVNNMYGCEIKGK